MNTHDQYQEVKRFVAPTMSRALELVREEMGPEAIILSSAKVDGGVEIVTSLERDYSTRGVQDRRSFSQNFDLDVDSAFESDSAWRAEAGIAQAAAQYELDTEQNSQAIKGGQAKADEICAALERAKRRMESAKQAAEADAERPRARSAAKADPKAAAVNDMRLDDLKGEIADLRMLLEQQLWQRPSATLLSAGQNEEPVSQALEKHLSQLGLSKSLLAFLCESAGRGRLSEQWKAALARLSHKIRLAQNLQVEKGGIFAFVGPTGVGKTTTIAKLASRYAIENGPGKVALISMDIHRVGALDQLKAMGRILDAPVRSVSASQGLLTVLDELKHFELILIDTAGFRQGDPKLKQQLSLIDEHAAIQRVLVLSSNSQYQTLKASIHAYTSRRGIDGCVLTKLDEAASLGEALSAVIDHELALAYTTDGQEIPKDIERASPHGLVAKAVSVARDSLCSSSGQ